MAGETIFVALQQILLEARIESCKTKLSQALKTTALEKGFAISDNQGEGNCMFFALSEQLDLIKGIQMSHDELRRTIVQHLRENPRLPNGTELFRFVDGYSSWDAYLTCMMADGTWGDHVILHCAANYFETCIHVISSLPHRHDVMICPEYDITGCNRLVLGHVHELHYVSLVPYSSDIRHGSSLYFGLLSFFLVLSAIFFHFYLNICA
ncbi:Glycosyl transferases group 1 [Porites harrisoni]